MEHIHKMKNEKTRETHVMFADSLLPDFKASIKRDVSELSTVAFGLMTPEQLNRL